MTNIIKQKFRLRNDLYCVEWGVKLYSLNHSLKQKLSILFLYGALMAVIETVLQSKYALYGKMDSTMGEFEKR